MDNFDLQTNSPDIKNKISVGPGISAVIEEDGRKSRHAITVTNKSPEEIFSFWRDFRNLSYFMKDVEEVIETSPIRSHWVVKLKNGMKAEWDAVVTQEVPGVMIAWKSLNGSDVDTTGSVWFTGLPFNRGSVVTLTMDYSVPGGKLGEIATKLMGEDPDSLAQINLHRLKAYLETGEVPTVAGQPSGREELPESNLTH